MFMIDRHTHRNSASHQSTYVREVLFFAVLSFALLCLVAVDGVSSSDL